MRKEATIHKIPDLRGSQTLPTTRSTSSEGKDNNRLLHLLDLHKEVEHRLAATSCSKISFQSPKLICSFAHVKETCDFHPGWSGRGFLFSLLIHLIQSSIPVQYELRHRGEWPLHGMGFQTASDGQRLINRNRLKCHRPTSLQYPRSSSEISNIPPWRYTLSLSLTQSTSFTYFDETDPGIFADFRVNRTFGRLMDHHL